MYVPCLTVTVLEDALAPGGESKSGDGPDPGVLDPGTGRCNCVSCWGGGEPAEVDPTDPGSLNPCVLLSSGVSKKLKLNSEPASKDTSGVILSGDGALPRLPLSDWSILKTSMLAQLGCVIHMVTRGSHPRRAGGWRCAHSRRYRSGPWPRDAFTRSSAASHSRGCIIPYYFGRLLGSLLDR